MNKLFKMDSAAAKFFSSPRFAVVGASQDERKFGYKVFAWYKERELPVTPINPKAPEISTPFGSESTVKDISALPSPSETALSIITPPAVTLSVLQEAKKLGIKSVWMQPGAFDKEGLDYAKQNFENAVGGFEGGTRAHDGWCVLVDGDGLLSKVEREDSKL